MTCSTLRIATRFALRDLRGGLRGFGVFLACVSLGVFAIVAVASISRGLSGGLSREGRRILGADVSFALIHRELNGDEREFLLSRGALSTVATMRAMARAPDGDATLVEVKAAPDTYPEIGAVSLAPAMPLAQALATIDGASGFVAEAALAARLNLHIGDEVRIGDARLVYRAELISEPDKLASGVGFGPRVIMSLDAFRGAGLAQPGSLVRWTYRVLLPNAADPAALVLDARKIFPQAGWEVRTSDNVSPQFEKNLQRLTQFLVLIGLTTLVVGGVGVANATRAFIDRKISDFATFKSLGASGGQAFSIALAEILMISILGVAIGLALGAAAPFLASSAIQSYSDLPFVPALYPTELATAALYGMLTALAFSLGPLGRAHDAPVAVLFRGGIDSAWRWPRMRYLAMLATAAGALIASIVALSTDRWLAAYCVIATGACLLLLRLIASAIMRIAPLLPRAGRFELRLAVASIHRPGAMTPSVILSLGLGLALLVALSLIDANLRAQLENGINGQTPSFFFLDLRNSDASAFKDFVGGQASDIRIEQVPMMRGRIARLNGARPEEIHASEDAAWALEGDRGITYAEGVPEGSTLTAGEWWSPDYAGPPLVSMEASVARGLGLKIGDVVTLNVLGRDITAKIANLRAVNWRAFGINFVFVFSPNTFAGAPHTMLATATFPDGGDATRELALMKAVSARFPAITSVRVKDALDAIRGIMWQLTLAIRVASGVALLAATLVLAGAVAAGQRAKLYEGVVLKTLGATRARLLLALTLEYGLLGLVTAIFGIAAGGLASWAVVSRVMKLDEFVWSWPASLSTVVLSLTLTIGVGVAGAWRVFGSKPATYLRDL